MMLAWDASIISDISPSHIKGPFHTFLESLVNIIEKLGSRPDPLSKPTVRLPGQLGLVTFSVRELEALMEVCYSTNAVTLFHFVPCTEEYYSA